MTDDMLEQVFNALSDGVLVVDMEFNIKKINNIVCHIKGFKEKNVIGKKCYELFENPICHTPDCPLKRIANGEEYVEHEIIRKRSNSNIPPFVVEAKPLRNSNQELTGIIEIFRDITDRNNSETELHKINDKYKSYINQSPYAVFIADHLGKYREINPACCSLLGYSEEELLTLSVGDIAKEDGLMLFEQLLKTGSINGECILIKKDGSHVIADIHAVSLEDNLYMAFVRDITEKKQAQEDLRKSEEHYRMFFENSPLGIGHFDQNGIITKCNTRFSEIMGAPKEKLIGFNGLLEITDASMRKALKNSLNKGLGIFEGSYLSVSGKKKTYLRAIFKGISSDSGTIIGGTGIFEDISERKQVEEALRNSETYNNMILEGITAGVALYEVIEEAHFKYIKANKNLLDYLGLKENEVIGRFIEEVVPAEIAENWIRNNRECVQKRQPVCFEEDHGENGILEIRLVPILSNEGKCTHFIAVITNITEQKKMEQHQLKMDKLESIGLLAGGIAHDFNNILTAIIGNASLLKMKVNNLHTDEREKILNGLIEIERASNQAKDLTQQLLTFAKGGHPILKTVAIGELLQETANFALTGSNVSCHYDIPNNLWPVEIDEGQINQVVNNLVVNAVHAMQDGGVLRITARNVGINGAEALPLEKGEYVHISFADHGHGIPKDYIDKIFDPYFTTKQMGSGLGLTTTYSVVRKHRGTIAVESEVGVGTIFNIYLPASPQGTENKSSTTPAASTGYGKVLVMDDERMIRHVLSEMLKELGYDAICVKDGYEAIEAYTEALRAAPFDVVIMDLTIPGGLGGKEAVKVLQDIDPNVKAIVSSGYSNNPVMAHHQEYGFKGIITKPYDIKELGDVLKKVINNVKTCTAV